MLETELRATITRVHDAALAGLARDFDVDASTGQKQLSWGMRIAALLGALALCAAVVLFFYRFWGLITTSGQVALLVAAPVTALGLTEFAARRERTLYFASLAAVVAFAAFVLALVVLGAIFNLPASPHAFLAWGALGFALAAAYELRLLLAAGLICLWIWLAAAAVSLAGADWTAFDRRPELFLLCGAGTLAAGTAGVLDRRDLGAMLRFAGLVALCWALIYLDNVGGDSVLPLRTSAVETLYQIVSFAIGAGVVALGIRSWWPEVTNTGAAFLVILIYMKAYDWFWDWMPKYLFFLLLGLIAVGCLAILRWLRGRTARVPL